MADLTEASGPQSDQLHILPCVECDQPMTRRGLRITFEGDYSLTTFTFECQASGCQCTATVEYRTFIPVDVARMRQD